MNGNTAKQLRRTAYMMSIGQPNVEYETKEHKVARKHTMIDHRGKHVTSNIAVNVTQVRLTEGCTRRKYHMLKDAYMRKAA